MLNLVLILTDQENKQPFRYKNYERSFLLLFYLKIPKKQSYLVNLWDFNFK